MPGVKKSRVFIEANNLHNQLKSVGLLEKDIDWRQFFAFALPEHYDLLRATWYHVGRIAPQPWYPSLAKRYCPPGEDVDDFMERSRRWYDGEVLRLQRLRDEVHARIAIENDLVDFRYVGVLKVNPFTQDRLGEKGIDVGLTVDMVTSVDAYDVAVIMAADYDLAEAVQYVKSRGKQVHHLAVEPGEAQPWRTQARGLRVLTDLVTLVYESDIHDPETGILRSSGHD